MLSSWCLMKSASWILAGVGINMASMYTLVNTV